MLQCFHFQQQWPCTEKAQRWEWTDVSTSLPSWALPSTSWPYPLSNTPLSSNLGAFRVCTSSFEIHQLLPLPPVFQKFILNFLSPSHSPDQRRKFVLKLSLRGNKFSAGIQICNNRVLLHFPRVFVPKELHGASPTGMNMGFPCSHHRASA